MAKQRPARRSVKTRDQKIDSIHRSMLVLLKHFRRVVTEKEDIGEAYVKNVRLNQQIRVQLYNVLYGAGESQLQSWTKLKELLPQ